MRGRPPRRGLGGRAQWGLPSASQGCLLGLGFGHSSGAVRSQRRRLCEPWGEAFHLLPGDASGGPLRPSTGHSACVPANERHTEHPSRGGWSVPTQHCTGDGWQYNGRRAGDSWSFLVKNQPDPLGNNPMTSQLSPASLLNGAAWGPVISGVTGQTEIFRDPEFT